MAKTNAYLVSFTPAERTAWGGITMKISLMGGGTNHRVEASSLLDLETQVRELGVAFGQTCCPYVRMADRKERKPAGFDKWADTVRVLN